MRKLFYGFTALSLAFLGFMPAQAGATPDYILSGDYLLTFTCVTGCGGSYPHTMSITVATDPVIGDFSGTGHYNPVPVITWTVTGNVDGNNITFLIDYDASAYTVNATGTIADLANMSGTAYSPSQTFTWVATGSIALADTDSDGINDGPDLCPIDTAADIAWSSEIWGTNRWEVRVDGSSNLVWYQNKPKGGATPTGYDIDYTYGCNGHQIIAAIAAATGLDFDGHYKYGPSKSLVEDWHNGVYFLETVPVSALGGVATSTTVLNSNYDYMFKAYGVADACTSGCADSIWFDPEYSSSDNLVTWVDGVAVPYTGYGPNLLDLMVNGGFIGWDDDTTYNADHTYWYEMTSADAPVSFQVYDVYYPNNDNNLNVDIYVKLF